jgi:CheY-like chemotaxis protein
MTANDPILLVEDDPSQSEVIQQVLALDRIVNRIVAVSSGEEAIDYLAGRGRFADRAVFPLPSLVLLDLKLPNLNGFEVLNWIRNSPTLQKMPVVVLTGSSDSGDIERAYTLGANSYLVKPFTVQELRAMVKSINAYWVILAQKPHFE